MVLADLLAEENTDPGRTLPRALIGGTVVLIVLYVLINAALLRVLPLSALAASDLPAAAAARMVFPRGGGRARHADLAPHRAEPRECDLCS